MECEDDSNDLLSELEDLCTPVLHRKKKKRRSPILSRKKKANAKINQSIQIKE